MAAEGDQRGRRMIRLAQLLLIVAALGLWVASRLPWVVVQSFDGLGQPKSVTLSGSTWSTALLPLALLLLATVVAVLAVRGWPLRILAILVAAVSGVTGYLAITQWVLRDVGVRAAGLAEVTVASLVGSQRHYWGAALTLAAAVVTLLAAVLLIRSASAGKGMTTKYVAPAARREAARRTPDEQLAEPAEGDGTVSERMLWDALDEGRDPTVADGTSDKEGR
ncbi:TIGR02234 family membrane protein [soil metagenome]